MRMFLDILLIVTTIAILFFLFFYFSGTSLAPDFQQTQTGSVCVKENCFQVELAKTQAEINRGLMHRKELDKNKGMLFIFNKEDIYPFWMKNTLIPLDMVWIDSSKKVVFISQDVQPCKSLICPDVIPLAKASYVLEVNAGTCKEINLKIGDEIKIDI